MGLLNINSCSIGHSTSHLGLKREIQCLGALIVIATLGSDQHEEVKWLALVSTLQSVFSWRCVHLVQSSVLDGYEWKVASTIILQNFHYMTQINRGLCSANTTMLKPRHGVQSCDYLRALYFSGRFCESIFSVVSECFSLGVATVE